MLRALSLVVLLFSLPASVRAQQDDPTQARAAFEEGLHFMDAGRYVDAAASFEHSLSLRESTTARYNLALAYRGAHQTRKAIETLRVLLASPAASAQSMLDDAARILADQERILVRVTLHIDGVPAEIRIDGEPMAPRVDQPVELDPGHHVFTARAADAETVSVERSFADGERAAVTIELARAHGATIPVTDAPPSTGPGVGPWILTIGSGALLVAGIVLVGVGLGDVSTVNGSPDGAMWSSVSGAYADAPVLSGLGFVAAGLGLVGVIAGIVWLVTGNGHADQAPVSLGPRGLSIAL